MLKFKNQEDRMLFSLLHPALIMIYMDMFLYAKENHNIELVITDTISTPQEDKNLGRVSESHQLGLALDIRTKNIDVFKLNDIINYINTRWSYKKYHYMSNSGIKRLAYYHIGTAEHIHLAIHKKYALPQIQKQVASLKH